MTLTVDIDEMEYVELQHAFARRGTSALKKKVAKILRRIDKLKGHDTGINSWWHLAHKGELY